MRRFFVIALVAIAALSACNEILGNSDGHYVPDAGSGDANADATRADGNATAPDASDAGFDVFAASSDGEAGPQTFCASISPAPAFCADFDEPMSDGGLYGFASEAPGSGCSLARDTTYTSPPLAVHALTSNNACYLSTTVTPTSSITVDLDLLIHSLPSSPGVDALFALHAGNAKYAFYATKGEVFLQGANGANQSNSDMLPPTLDVYKHVQMKLALTAGSNPTISGTYDTTTITFAGKTTATTQGPFEPKTATELRVGIPEVVFSNVGDVHIDNVVVTIQ
jgi:hypothetical protein